MATKTTPKPPHSLIPKLNSQSTQTQKVPKISNFIFGNKKTDNLVSAFILSLFCNFGNRGG